MPKLTIRYSASKVPAETIASIPPTAAKVVAEVFTSCGITVRPTAVEIEVHPVGPYDHNASTIAFVLEVTGTPKVEEQVDCLHAALTERLRNLSHISKLKAEDAYLWLRLVSGRFGFIST